MPISCRRRSRHCLIPAGTTGQLQVTSKGTLTLTDIRTSDLHTTIGLTGASAAVGAYRCSIDTLAADIDLQNGKGGDPAKRVMPGCWAAKYMLGSAVPMDAISPAHLDFEARDIHIEQTLRSRDPNALPPYAGNLTASLKASAPLASWNTQADGNGTARSGRRTHRKPPLPRPHCDHALWAFSPRRSANGAHGLHRYRRHQLHLGR